MLGACSCEKRGLGAAPSSVDYAQVKAQIDAIKNLSVANAERVLAWGWQALMDALTVASQYPNSISTLNPDHVKARLDQEEQSVQVFKQMGKQDEDAYEPWTSMRAAVLQAFIYYNDVVQGAAELDQERAEFWSSIWDDIKQIPVGIGQAIGGVASGIAGGLSGGLISGLLSNPLGLAVLAIGGWYLYRSMKRRTA